MLIYHTIRQLRLVSTINSHYLRINLYQLEPVQSFSRLTGSTALSLLVFVYVWMLINPELFTDPVLIGYLVIFTLIAVFVFVWPLWGIHRMIEAEKTRVALMKSCVRFFLLMLTATVGGSEVIWKTVFATCPLRRSPWYEPIMYMP